MIVKEDFLKKLRSAFDLNIYEAKIWTALLSKGIATAGELSDISNVPRSRSYDVLESLEKRGFVVMKLGKPIKYIAVEPKEIVNRVKKDLKKRAEERVQSIEDVSKTNLFGELNLLYKNGVNHIDPMTISGAIRGRNNVYSHMEGMIRNAKKSVVIATSGKGLMRKGDNFGNLLKKLSDKGVKVKIAAPVNKENMKLVKQLNFADVRNVKTNARFVLVDDKELLFMINDDEKVHESYDIGIWVNSPFFVNALSNLFESSWKKVGV